MALAPRTDLKAEEHDGCVSCRDSNHLDFAGADRIDAGTHNDILWGSVKGGHAIASGS